MKMKWRRKDQGKDMFARRPKRRPDDFAVLLDIATRLGGVTIWGGAVSFWRREPMWTVWIETRGSLARKLTEGPEGDIREALRGLLDRMRRQAQQRGE